SGGLEEVLQGGCGTKEKGRRRNTRWSPATEHDDRYRHESATCRHLFGKRADLRKHKGGPRKACTCTSEQCCNGADPEDLHARGLCRTQRLAARSELEPEPSVEEEPGRGREEEIRGIGENRLRKERRSEHRDL